MKRKFCLPISPHSPLESIKTIDSIFKMVSPDTIVGINLDGFYADPNSEGWVVQRNPLTLREYLRHLEFERRFRNFYELVDVLADESRGIDVSEGLLPGVDKQIAYRRLGATTEGRGEIVTYTPDVEHGDPHTLIRGPICDGRAAKIGAAATTLALLDSYFQRIQNPD
jgi:hypothetical protein